MRSLAEPGCLINKWTSGFHASVLLLIMNFVIDKVAVDPRGHEAIAEWITDYFDNDMTKFIVN